MSIQGFNPNVNTAAAAVRDQQAVQTASKQGATSAAARSTELAEKTAETDSKEESELSKAARDAMLEDNVLDGVNTPSEFADVSKDLSQEVCEDRVQEHHTGERTEAGQGEHEVPEGMVRAGGSSGSASEGEEPDAYELTDIQSRRLDRMDRPSFARELNSDIDPAKLSAAGKMVETQLEKTPEKLADELKTGDAQFEQQVAGMELRPAEPLEQAARPMVEQVSDPTNDAPSRPMQVEDKHADEMARMAVKSKMASGEIAAGEEFMAS